LRLSNLKASKEGFVDTNTVISCVLPKDVSINFSNRLISIVRAILFGGLDNEKVAFSQEKILKWWNSSNSSRVKFWWE